MRSTLLVVAFAASAAALRVVPRPIEVQPTRRDALATSAAVFGAFATLSFPQAALAAPPATLASTFSFESQITPLIGGLDVIGLSRFEDQLSTPKGSALPSVKVKFDFPTQWTRLNSGGGIVYVDGATGLKTYVLKVPLPPRDEADGGGVLPLSETPKAYLGQALFAQGGALAKDAEIDDFKVSSAKMVDGSARPRKRLQLKYTVITPANQRAVDRRAVADAVEVDGVAYVLLASATGSKWEQEGPRCERTAESFAVGD